MFQCNERRKDRGRHRHLQDEHLTGENGEGFRLHADRLGDDEPNCDDQKDRSQNIDENREQR